MTNGQTSLASPSIHLVLRRKKNEEEMKHQLILFLLMMFLTVLAFIAVGYEEFSLVFQKPFIILLALVQVVFQLFYFMHLKHKGHAAPALFLFSGIGFSLIMMWTFLNIVWW